MITQTGDKSRPVLTGPTGIYFYKNLTQESGQRNVNQILQMAAPPGEPSNWRVFNQPWDRTQPVPAKFPLTISLEKLKNHNIAEFTEKKPVMTED